MIREGTSLNQRHGAEIVLASASPRRRELIQRLGIPCTYDVAEVDERVKTGEPPEALVRRLSLEKAQVVAARHPEAIVIGADTVVVLDGIVLGKPESPEQATQMLKALRARPHDVLSAVAVVAPHHEPLQRLCRTTVWMRPYTDEELAAYVASGDPMDKAGAYAIQHPTFRPVERWEGCYLSVVGLPLADLVRLLERAGVSVPRSFADVCEAATGFRCSCAVRMA